MGMKAVFLNGADEATAQGRLHQWDRGRTLEIHADDLPAVVEVHFAHAGLDAAIVYTCAVTGGETPVATVAIPDLCLQQASTLTAWVYKVGETTGETIKTITLPLTPRTRPDDDDVVPEEFVSKYTQAMEAMETAASTNIAEMNAAAAACIEEVDARKAELSDPQYVAKRAETVYKDGVTMFSTPTQGDKLPRAGFYLLTRYRENDKAYTDQAVVYWDGSSRSNTFASSTVITPDGRDVLYSYAVSNVGTITLTKYIDGASTVVKDAVIRISRIG